ncbi:MAG: YdcF family protein, partial [Acidobacteria bacterium]|nr:YdcF family protein [Acidobacteriota bacterium]
MAGSTSTWPATHRRAIAALLVAVAIVVAAPSGTAWGVRAHTWINRVAVRTLPDDGPAFLKAHEDWIAYLSVIPDAWRRPSEPFLKMLEDPNHGWFKEQFSFMTEIPRSRYEFVLKLYDEQRRLAAAGDPAAALTNVRWTGTMAYAAVEGYERMLTGMRTYRALRERKEDTRFAELEIAYAMGWTGHYTADGAQPLHDTVHHDGWQGANPLGYTTDPRVHGLFETRFVDLMQLEGGDIQPQVPAARRLADPFTAIVEHLDEAGRHTEQVYKLEKAGALADAANVEARTLVIRQTARGAALLRDLAYTAWLKSGEPPANDPGGNPIVPAHPRYNPATGSAPAHVAPPPGGGKVQPPPAEGEAAPGWRPITFADPVIGKNFYLLDAVARTPRARAAVEQAPALKALREAKVQALAKAATSCGTDTTCIAAAFVWTAADIASAERALVALAAGNDDVRALIARDLRPSGMVQAYAAGDDAALIAGAWRETAAGLNRIIETYAQGKAPRYPKIDAVSYDPASESYRRLVGIMASVLHEQRDDLTTFYAPSLSFARRLLDANRRDEAGRFEPMHDGENAAAVRRVSAVRWADVPYAAIVVPGAGPDREDVALDPWAKMRLELAVMRYRKGQAPFILVSGGYVHPNQTPFNEALEMKRALVRDFGVPAAAVIIDPHARHTTTNLRNAARLALRYGLPP